MTLKNLLDNGKIFKLVCGAGNECAEDVERYVTLYSKAGAQFFDICAKPEILLAAKRGLSKSGKKGYICVSVGMKGDPHIFKAYTNDNCIKCGECDNLCPYSAVQNSVINKEKCIGCSRCYNNCKYSGIDMIEEDMDLDLVLPELINMGIDCIELHVSSDIDLDIQEKWDIINKHFDGIVSICIDRLNLGNKQVLERLNKMLSIRKPFTTIIQADGIPFSGCDDNYKTTLQAVAMAEIVQDAKLPTYLLISGGTNSKTSELAKMCNIHYNGIAIGSYARKLVKDFISNPDFYSDKIFNEGLVLAKELVEVSLK